MDNILFNYYKESLIDNLCDEYRNEWRARGDDRLALLSLAMRQQSIPHVATYAYQGKGVTKDYIKNEYGSYINGVSLHDCDGVHGYTYQLWVDVPRGREIVLKSDVSSFMWTRGTNVTIAETKCPIIYISNKSSVNLTLNGFNSVVVYLFDESTVNIDESEDTCKITVYKYSDKAKVFQGKYSFGVVKEFNKELRL